MTILQKIRDDLLAARKARNTIRSGYLSTLLGDLDAIGKNAHRDATDAEVVATLKKYIKNTEVTHDALMASTADVDEQLTHNLAEKLIYESYLPRQLTEEELRAIIARIPTPTNVGAVMAELKKNYAGLYDGALASKLVKELI